MACCADIYVSQDSVATCARCGGTFNIHLTANLPEIFWWKNCKSVKIWQNYGHESVAPFLAHPVETERQRESYVNYDVIKRSSPPSSNSANIKTSYMSHLNLTQR